MTDATARQANQDRMKYGIHDVFTIEEINNPADNMAVVAKQSPSSDSFGASGDSFDHGGWRGIMDVLWNFEPARKSLVALGSLFMLRGKEMRVQNKGKAIRFEIPLPNATDPGYDRSARLFGVNITFPLIVHCPTEMTKMTAKGLTIERFKCLLRVHMTPMLMKEKRFPAVSMSIGYGNLCEGFLEFHAENAGVNLPEIDDDTSNVDKLWIIFIKSSRDNHLTNICNPSAAVSGCFSSKEIYPFDEEVIPGTVFWSGLHALMTDASCKLKAASQPEDKRYSFENSSFYPDFKRKMAARSMNEVKSPRYITFLKSVAPLVSFYLKSTSMMDIEEVAILDTIMKEARDAEANAVRKVETAQTEATATVSMTSTNYQAAEEAMRLVGNRMWRQGDPAAQRQARAGPHDDEV